MPGRHFSSPGRRLVFLCLLALAPTANAEMYTWTDDQGVTHFSDQAPVADNPEQVTLGTSSFIPMADNVQTGKKVSAIHRQIEQALERDEPEQSSSTRNETSLNQKQCDKLTQRLETIQKQLRAGYSNDRGNRLRRQRRNLGQRYSRECVLG